MEHIASFCDGQNRHIPRRCGSVPGLDTKRRKNRKASSPTKKSSCNQMAYLDDFLPSQFRIGRILFLILPGLAAVCCLSLLIVSTAMNATDYEVNNPHRHPFIRSNNIRTVSQRRTNSKTEGGRYSLFSAINTISHHQENQLHEEPRFLVFGTRSTYGVGLENPLQEAYPYQLSSYTHNAATRNGGFTLAAACTQSIVRDDVYNAIIVEFTTWETALTVLVERLRLRFPYTPIVFLRLWHPSQLKYEYNERTFLSNDIGNNITATATTTRVIDFHAYRRLNGKDRAMDDPELFLDIYSEKNRWFFAKPKDDALVLDMASKYNASYFAMNMPDKDLFEYPKTMMDQLSIFEPSGSGDDLNKVGHTLVATSLKSILRSTNFPSPEKALQVRPWEAGGDFKQQTDLCRLWFETGLYPQQRSLEAHDAESSFRLRRVEFSNAGAPHQWTTGKDNHKHALEVDDGFGGSLTIENPFREPRMLYLTYLTSFSTGGEDSDDEESSDDFAEFSTLRIRINNKPAVMIEAYHQQGDRRLQNVQEKDIGGIQLSSSSPLHNLKAELARTTAVGVVPYGKSVLYFDSVATPVYKTSRPFRLLGWSLLPQQVVDSLQLQNIEFALEESEVLSSTTD